MFAFLSASRKDVTTGLFAEHPDFSELSRLPLVGSRRSETQTTFQRDYGDARSIADKAIGFA